MLTRHYTLHFATPAFLGNAEQSGQWRTPPIKALLRQWWRVAYAAGQPGAVNVGAMREAEGRLFGTASDNGGSSSKSLVRVRLGNWSLGKLTSWDQLEQAPIRHPETERTGYKVGSHAYLGFGPLDGRGGTRLAEKCHAAIQAGEEASLSVAFPVGTEATRLDKALWLMHRYGTLGGRSRNGWGSFSLTPTEPGTAVLDGTLDESLTTDWQAALSLDWPHAIGRDTQGTLIWQTDVLANWKVVMRRLAEIKIGLRTQQAFTFTTGKNAASPELRHWLSYPVTNHNLTAWKENGKRDFRLPNSLRFKVRADSAGKLRGVIFHVPCKPPAAFQPDLAAVRQVWQRVHDFLGQPDQKLQRIAA